MLPQRVTPLPLQAYVITLTRAGEDKVFKLSDPESTLSSFAGADYDLNDAVTAAEDIRSSKRDEGGRIFYDYEVEGLEVVYYVSVTVDQGKVFALFVSSPVKNFSRSKDTMASMIKSFELIG